MVYDTVFPIKHGSRNQGVEARVAPRTVTPHDALGHFVLAVLTAVGPAGLERLVLKGVTLSPGDTAELHSTISYGCHPGHLELGVRDLKSSSHHSGGGD